jgi:KDO2-lipid IV(A) lauroyltransferase
VLNKLIVKMVLYLFKKVPLLTLESFARLSASLSYPLLKKRKRFALANLNLVFGERLSSLAKKKILKQNLFLFTRGLLEIGKSLYLPPDFFSTHFNISGEEYLKALYLKGKGVIAISAHMGNFPLLTIYLALKGYHVAAIAKIPKRGPLTQILKLFSKKFGLYFIQAREGKKSVHLARRHLQQGGFLFLQIDQNAPRHRAMIPFFNHCVPTPRGPIILAQKTGASILPIFILDEPNFYHRVFIEPPLKLKGNIELSLKSLTQIVESYISRYPEQWLWYHRRFKEHIAYDKL